MPSIPLIAGSGSWRATRWSRRCEVLSTSSEEVVSSTPRSPRARTSKSRSTPRVSTRGTRIATRTCAATTSFDVDAYPEIRFVSSSVRETDDGKYRVVGDLTIKHVTKPVTVDFVYTGTALDPYGNQRIGFEGSAVVNRKDWDLTWNALLETGGLLVSENVTLEFDVSAIKQA